MPKRYYEPIEVEFGESVVVVEPLRGKIAIDAFEKSIVKFINDYSKQLTTPSDDIMPTFATDMSAPLMAGCPALSKEVIANSTSSEQYGLMQDLCEANNLGSYIPFFDTLRIRMPKILKETMEKGMDKALAGEDFSQPSSAPDSPGETSTTS